MELHSYVHLDLYQMAFKIISNVSMFEIFTFDHIGGTNSLVWDPHKAHGRHENGAMSILNARVFFLH